MIAASGIGGQIAIIRSDTGELVRTVLAHEMQNSSGSYGVIQKIVFSTDGKVFATGATDGIVIVWDTNTGREVERITEGFSSVRDVVFHLSH